MFKTKFSVKNVSPGETFYKDLSRQVDLFNAITKTKNITYIRSGDQYILCSNTDGKQWHMKYLASIDHHNDVSGVSHANVEFRIAPVHKKLILSVLFVSVIVFLSATLAGFIWLNEHNLAFVRAFQFMAIGSVIATLIIAYFEFFLMEKRIKSLIRLNKQ